MSFFLNDDGSIVFDRTNDQTIAALKKAIAAPEAQRRLGLVDAGGEPTPPRTWANMTTTLVDALNSIAIQAAVNAWKLTDDQARVLVLKNDPKVHEQTVQLSGALLDKYFPGGFGEYDLEISFLLLVGGFTVNAVQKIAAMKEAGPREVLEFRDASQQS